jgi:hypothetical protein
MVLGKVGGVAMGVAAEEDPPARAGLVVTREEQYAWKAGWARNLGLSACCSVATLTSNTPLAFGEMAPRSTSLEVSKGSLWVVTLQRHALWTPCSSFINKAWWQLYSPNMVVWACLATTMGTTILDIFMDTTWVVAPAQGVLDGASEAFTSKLCHVGTSCGERGGKKGLFC